VNHHGAHPGIDVGLAAVEAVNLLKDFQEAVLQHFYSLVLVVGVRDANRQKSAAVIVVEDLLRTAVVSPAAFDKLRGDRGTLLKGQIGYSFVFNG
jgi:hypothetical protein